MDEYSGVGDTERARRWPERGRAGGGQGLCRGGVAPLPWWGWPGLGSRITWPRWRCRASRSRLAHGCAVSQAGGESPGALLVLRAAAGQVAIYISGSFPAGGGQDRITLQVD